MSSNSNKVDDVSEFKKITAEESTNINAFELTPKEKREMCANIDRNQESIDVIKFQNTGNMDILDKLYENRIQTLKIWSRKYHYIGMSQEDVFAALSVVFINTIKRFKNNKKHKNKFKTKKIMVSGTPFNTYLYYSLKNYVINQWNRKRAKKRMVDNIPAENMTLSLDYSYDNEGDSSFSLIDTIPNEKDRSASENINLKETLSVLSNGKTPVYEFLEKLSEDEKLTSLLRELKRYEGSVKIKSKQALKYPSGKKNLKEIREIIRKQKNIIKPFSVVNYSVKNNTLYYVIELKKTKEHDIMSKEIRRIRRNRDHYKNILSIK